MKILKNILLFIYYIKFIPQSVYILFWIVFFVFFQFHQLNLVWFNFYISFDLYCFLFFPYLFLIWGFYKLDFVSILLIDVYFINNLLN
jgi:hypothetical protein